MIEQTENRLTVAEAQNICLRNNIPFYTYRLPGSREVIFGAQLSNDTRIFKGFEKHRGEKGFVITPFNHSSWSFPFFIKADLSFTDYLTDGEAIRNLQNTVFNTPERIFTKQDCEHFEYLDELRTMIDTLKREGMKKAVLSRTITIPCDSLRLSPAIFEQMKQYHHAFLFFAAIPGKCAWNGCLSGNLSQIRQERILHHVSGRDTTRGNGKETSGVGRQGYRRTTNRDRLHPRYIKAFLYPPS